MITAYAFVNSAQGVGADTVMQRLVDSGVAERAAAVSGIYDVIARIEATDMPDLSARLLAAGVVGGVQTADTAVAADTAAVTSGRLAGPIPLAPMRGIEDLKDVVAFVLCTVEEAIEAVIAAVTLGDALLGAAVLVGGPYDLLLRVRARDVADVNTMVVTTIAAMPGVMRTTTLYQLAITPPGQ